MQLKLSNTLKKLEITKIAKVDQGLLRSQQIKQQLTDANSKIESLTQELCEKKYSAERMPYSWECRGIQEMEK